MPFVAPKSTTSSGAAPNSSGRTTFRPPWVKDEPASTVKTSVPWAKKTTTATTADKAKEENGGEKATAKKPVAAGKKVETPTKSPVEPAKKATTSDQAAKKVGGAVKKAPEPVKKIVAPVKKTIEPVAKKPAASSTPSKTAVAKKKEPTPPSSTSEEESEEEEEESDEEESEEETEEEEESDGEEEDSGEETDDSIREVLQRAAADMKAAKALEAKKRLEEESELKKRFTLEKPKLRPVVVKRDMSMKKINGDDDDDKLQKPNLRHVKREEKPLPAKSTDNILKIRPTLKKVPKIDEILKEPKEEPKPEFKTKTLRKAPSIKREQSIKNVPAPPPLPSLVPKAPPPPPPPLGANGEKRELTPTQKEVIERLKTRPRRRPDWSEMMKEVESGKKLRHVECNDRSQPIITCKSMTKVDDKFIYETEKDNSHNKLLKQIQFGVKLKPTKTNDRSKPVLDGLRKFRRQMTIEEQLQKSQSKINMLTESAAGGTSAAAPLTEGSSSTSSSLNPLMAALVLDDVSGDELDDIDKIRDDLQSTKQMLALELRNREAQERENKKLLAKIATLEAELEREKSREKNLEYGSNVIVATMDPTPAAEDIFVANLKKEAEEARKHSKELEKKYLDTGELLDEAKSEIEEQRQQIKMLEKKLAQALQGGGSLSGSRRQSEAHLGRDSSPEFDLEMSESDPDEPEEKKTERRERRLAKEVKVLRSKLTKLKVKEEAAKKEKVVLKQAMKKNHIILKEENKKFKKLEKEVHKMAASMKEDYDDDDDEDGAPKDDDDEDADAAEQESEEEEESEEESEESESEESGAETESESEAEDASNTDKKSNLEPRVKKHEGRLSAAKKCNVLLQANVDNIQDEITQVRSKASNLQAELDSVLADLGL